MDGPVWKLGLSPIDRVAILATSSCVRSTKISDRIESSAKNSYVFKTFLKDDAITIKAVNDSVVVLTGIVSEWVYRLLAEETVYGIEGVNMLKMR